MGLFTKTKTYTYKMLSPVIGDSYNYTIDYGNSSKKKTPLDAIMTRELCQYHANGLSNINNMKCQLKDLREIHNLPMLRKTSMFRRTNEIIQSSKSNQVIDTSNIEKTYGSPVVQIEYSAFSPLGNEYISKITGGRFKSVYDIGVMLWDNIVPDIEKKLGTQQVATGGNSLSTLKNKLVRVNNLDLDYIGNNKFNIHVIGESILEGNGEIHNYEGTDRVDISFEKTLSEYFYNLWELIGKDSCLLVKLANGEVILITDEFFNSWNKHIDFSVSIGLQDYLYFNRDEKLSEIARGKLGYQEKKNKKRNRQELLYEQIQKNEDITGPVDINLYLDLYPFKDPRYRNDRNWRLFLKGVMKYFAKICGIAEQDNATAGVEVIMPIMISQPLGSVAQYMSIEMSKEVITSVDMGKKTPLCYFESKGKENYYTKSVIKGDGSVLYLDSYKAQELETVWLYLITDRGDGTYMRYGLNYSKFHEGIEGTSGETRAKAEVSILDEINSKIYQRAKDENDEDVLFFYEEERQDPMSDQQIPPDVKRSIDNILSREKNTYWHDTRDRSLAYLNDKKEIIDRIAFEQDEGGFHPRLPMPILMWNMIPYCAKKVAYTSSLLIAFKYEVEVEESTGLGEFLAFLGAAVSIIFTMGSATPAIAMLSSTAVKTLTVVGTLTSLAGSLSGEKIFSYIGGAIGLGLGLASAYNSIGNFSNLSTLNKFGNVLGGLNTINNLASQVRGINMEKELRELQSELEANNDAWEIEKKSRNIDTWGGVVKTNAAADEEIDEKFELCTQEGLFKVLTSYIDMDENNNIFNDKKYDNTR